MLLKVRLQAFQPCFRTVQHPARRQQRGLVCQLAWYDKNLFRSGFELFLCLCMTLETGALLMASLDNGLSLKNVPDFIQDIVKGGIPVSAVGLDVLGRRRQ
jgi:hypothetical protein